jgi:pilus assembly protein Flp/PilA
MVVRLTSDKSSKAAGKSRNQRGATLVEYALLVALVAVAAIGGITVLGTNTSTKFSGLASTISANN